MQGPGRGGGSVKWGTARNQTLGAEGTTCIQPLAYEACHVVHDPVDRDTV
jgi:hypothetical protein